MELQLNLRGHYLDFFFNRTLPFPSEGWDAKSSFLGNKCERLSILTAKYINYAFSLFESCITTFIPVYMGRNKIIPPDNPYDPSKWLAVLYLEGAKTKKAGLNHEVRLCFVPDLRLFLNSVISVWYNVLGEPDWTTVQNDLGHKASMF